VLAAPLRFGARPTWVQLFSAVEKDRAQIGM
jgi:hypothetical protein